MPTTEDCGRCQPVNARRSVPNAVPATFAPEDPGANPILAQLTTLGIGGPVQEYREVHSNEELMAVVQAADEVELPLLVLGGGSNILAGDQPFPGVVVRDRRQDLRIEHDSACGGVVVVLSAGYPWDLFVATAVENEWMGIEALSGIPGSVGAAPVQNIGAYGQEVAETLTHVLVYDRARKTRRHLAVSELELSYRNSLIKRSLTDEVAGGGRTWGPTGRFVVLEAGFQLRHASLAAPVRYQQLANALGVELGARVPSRDVRAAVLELRRSKGMVLDPQDPNSRSAGSFFTNPILTAEQAAQLPPDAPRFPVRGPQDRKSPGSTDTSAAPVELVKTSAAWLMDHAGFGKGYRVRPDARAALSEKHALAVTNRGEADAGDIAELARAVVDGVAATYGITLVPEPVSVGFDF